MIKSIKRYFFDGSLSLLDKLNRFLLLIIRLSLIGAIIWALFEQRWMVLVVSLATLVLTFVPRIFEDRYKIDLPAEFEIIVVLFIYATLFLGEVHNYYTRFWWWDMILHASSAIALGFIGFTILYILYKSYKIQGSVFIVAVFTFFFALGIGALWEIFEFGVDLIFGTNMQKSELDTMVDLIVDAIGALIASVSGYFYLKKNETFILSRVVRRFENLNPRFFRNR